MFRSISKLPFSLILGNIVGPVPRNLRVEVKNPACQKKVEFIESKIGGYRTVDQDDMPQ